MLCDLAVDGCWQWYKMAVDVELKQVTNGFRVSLPLLPPAGDLPDVAVFKERLRILTVGGTRNDIAGVSLRSAVKTVVHL